MPINANLREVDPDCDLNFVRDAPRRQRVRMTMSNSFGFGGSNSCIVLRHPDETERRRGGAEVSAEGPFKDAGLQAAHGRSAAAFAMAANVGVQ